MHLTSPAAKLSLREALLQALWLEAEGTPERQIHWLSKRMMGHELKSGHTNVDQETRSKVVAVIVLKSMPAVSLFGGRVSRLRIVTYRHSRDTIKEDFA